MNPYLRLGLDLGPLVVFFVANSYFGIYVATGAIMAAVTVSIGIGYLIERKVTPMPIVTLALVLVFGGLTLWLEDETFIKIRPTIVYTMFTTVLFAGLYYGHSLIKMLLHAAFTLSEEGWRILTVRWAAMFAGLAVVNELVWRNFSTDAWVFYNTWGDLAITLVFAMLQTPVIMRHQLNLEDAAAPDNVPPPEGDQS